MKMAKKSVIGRGSFLFSKLRGLIIFISMLGVYLFLIGCGDGFKSVITNTSPGVGTDNGKDDGTHTRTNSPPYLDDGSKDDGGGTGDNGGKGGGGGSENPVPTLIPTPVPTLIPTPVPTLIPTPIPTLIPTPIPTVPPTPEYSHSDSFTQAPFRRLVDILFVVDNSGSMQDDQTDLARNFETFINVLQTKNFDFQIGVTTTGVDDSALAGKLEGGLIGWPPQILKPATVSLTAAFASNVQVGTQGSYSEKGLEGALEALRDNSARLLRNDAMLNIIFVSDEQDLSDYEAYKDPDTDAHPRQTHPNWTPDYYMNQYLAFKNNDRSMVRAHAIVATSHDYNQNDQYADFACPNGKSIMRGLMNVGSRYIDVANALNGEVKSICTDRYSDILGAIGQNIISNNTFVLEHSAIAGTLEVRLNGNVVPSSAYHYVAASHSIVFDTNIPAEGAQIQVLYQSLEQ